MGSSIDHNDSDEQLEKMEQDNASSHPSIHELLSLLLKKTNSIEATLSAILATQNQHNEILTDVSQTLGVNVEMPSITTYINDSIAMGRTTQNMTRPLAAPTRRTPLSPTRTTTPSIQNESLEKSNVSITSSSRKQHQQQELPSKFVQAPRMKRKGNVIQAIYSLAASPIEGQKMMAFLNSSANMAVRQVYKKAASNQADLGGSWTDQDENVRKEAVEWLIQTVANFRPSIPLTKCEDDWIIKYLFPRKYNDFIYQEKKRIRKKELQRGL